VHEIPVVDMPRAPDPALPWRLVAQGSDPLLQEVRDAAGVLRGYLPLPRLQVVRELDALGKSLREQQPAPPIRWQRIAPTRAALSNLATNEPLLFHFTGHGNVENGQPTLCFDDGTGRLDSRPVRDLAARLRGRACLAFLNACRTADSAEPGANLALALVQGGIPVVLGTQYSVFDSVAAPFAWTFYQHLAAGEHPAVALWYARYHLRDSAPTDPRQWAIPALYVAAGYPWPHQRGPGAPPESIDAPPLKTSALQAPDLLLGRANELVELASLFVLDSKQIVTIRGAGGMGKTALAHALAERLRFHFPGGVYALTLALPEANPNLSAAVARRQLADLLGVAGAKPFEDPSAAEAQEQVLVEAAQGRKLLIFDNYETVLWRLGRDSADPNAAAGVADASDPNLQSAISDLQSQRAEADAVQRLAARLAKAGVHLLFTTRESPVRLPGEALYPSHDREAQLLGLDKASAADLFRLHAGERGHSAGFPALVAEQVGYSPLAIQLAASRWGGNQTEAEFLQNIDDELMQAKQDGVPDHQRSAIANVRLSINALPVDLRRQFLELTIIANPLIQPIHGAVIWGLEDDKAWFADQAHQRLERLQGSSLLQGLGRDEGRNWALAYSIQPVIAQVARRLAQAIDLSAARARYAAWADQIVTRAYGEGGIRYSEEVARATQAALPDLPAALPLLPAEQRGSVAWRAAWVFGQLGRPAEAVQMLDLVEAAANERADQSLISRVQNERANQLVTRGDLDGALRLYDQALAIKERLGDVQGTSATLHAKANVLVTRGDLDGALALYDQALAIRESLGDVRGAGVTLANTAHILAVRGDTNAAIKRLQQSLAISERLGDLWGKAHVLRMLSPLQFRAGDRDTALHNARESLRLFERLGATREIAQVRDILSQIERANGGAQPADLTPAQLAGRLVALTTAALRGQRPSDQVRVALAQLLSDGGASGAATTSLHEYIAALIASLDGADGAASALLAAAGPLLAAGTPAERADALVGIANVAELLEDAAIELAAHRQAIAAQRDAGAERETLVALSVMLYNVAMLHTRQGDHAAAVPLLEEVVALDERTGHPDLESDRAALESVRQRAAGVPDATLRDAIGAWRDGGREEAGLITLLDAICGLVIAALRDGTTHQREALAEDLAQLRAVRPLPIAGASDFLHVFQLWLRGEPEMIARAERIRAALPADLAQALTMIERMIAGEDQQDIVST
jgi:tetratricopeptide (TPR) repeat protein